MSRFPLLSLVLAASIAILFIAFGPASELLIYQRQAVQNGELGRLISAHFSHSDGEHLAWNVLALLILGGLLEHREGTGAMLFYLIVGIISVNMYIIWQSELATYCGLSGVLNALLIGVLASLFSDPARRTLSIWIGLAALAKIIIEVTGNTALITHTAWPSVPLAHLYGLCGGLVLAVFSKHLYNRKWLALLQSDTRTNVKRLLVNFEHPTQQPSPGRHSCSRCSGLFRPDGRG